MMTSMPALGMAKARGAVRAGAAAVCFSVLLAATAGHTSGQSAPADPVIATVNGAPIHESDLQLADEMIGRNLPVQEKRERRDALLTLVIDSMVLAQVAKDRKIADEADLQRRASYARNQGLMNHLLEVVGQQAVTEDAVRKAYQEVVVKPATDQIELHLRHLVFKFPDANDAAAASATEVKAKAAFARIDKGEDFAAVAADLSEDPATKARGGDFDWRTRPEMGKEYADVAFALKPGEVSAPIKTAFGWHIIKLEERRPRKPVEFEKIRDRVAAMVANAARFDLVDKARSAATIERFDRAQAAPNKQSSN
ncbi:peptidylprolyl isomerase [Rhodopseudomonas palustris]|uniref:Parvulin-like PPIase n=1 Tax=Rhodopseudomonas palustris (strain BisB18) TaxID=316056 RepID=Q212Z1_RHOPB